MIDEQGKIAKIFDKVNVEEHADEWAKAISGMGKAVSDFKDEPLAQLKKELPETTELFGKVAGTGGVQAFTKSLAELAREMKKTDDAMDASEKKLRVYTSAIPLHVTALEGGAKSANELANAFDALGTKTQEIKTVFEETWPVIQKAVTDALTAIGTKVTEIWDAASAKVTEVHDAISAKVKEVWEAIPEDIRTSLQQVVDRIGELLGQAKDDVAKKWEEIQEAITTTLGNIVKAVGEKFSEIGTAVSTKLGEWLTTVTTKGAEIEEAATAPWAALADAIGPHLQAALSAVTTFAGSVVSELGSLAQQALTGARAIGDAIISGITAGINAGLQSIKDAAGNAARAALDEAKRRLGVPEGGGPVQSFGGGAGPMFFQQGGIVPGPRGMPHAAIVHGGETIIPAGQGAGMSINFYGPVYGLDDLASKIDGMIRAGRIRSVPSGY